MDPFLGEIRVFAGSYAPAGWAQCNGQLLSIARFTALYSILGTMYGGDGRSTFALPNLQGRASMSQGQGTGQTLYYPGDMGGTATVTLTQEQMPAHNHNAGGSLAGSSNNPSGNIWANMDDRPAPSYFTDAPGTPQRMSPAALQMTGGNLPHNNLMPFQVLNYCIALQGEFPPRS